MFQEMEGLGFIEGFSDIEKWMSDGRHLVVIDDLMSEKYDGVTKLLMKGRNHRNLSSMYIVQNMFAKTESSACSV